ncbi:GNAT family N-acetyltransferase [uncultured Bacteroides sp.]|uniref:GNAT family N-acetyltransferase n=1 Tax=uncultured Bacteroides sp. TaxID=162156 RepID=UPI002AA81C24|nr:GNAT family N-acetyltransferase [uncultured Bacteroides sp.]
MTAKEQYRELCKEENTIPLFCQDWWMDAVCFDEWDVLLTDEKGEIVGALPYHLRKKLGFCCVLQPQLTQYNGIWIKRKPAATDNERLSFEKKIFNELIEQLENLRLSFYQQCFHLSITNWLPFYWRGYRQTTRYTYVISSIGNPEKVFSRFSPAKQRQIRKCEDKLHLSLDMRPDEFYSHHKQSLKERGEEISYSYELFQRIYKATQNKNAGQLFAIKDDEGEIHACLFVVWDKASAYTLLYSIPQKHASSGASTLVIWEAIKFLVNKTRSFDFEGSMVEGIENSYRQFATTQKPYFLIEKYYSRLFRLLFSIYKERS